MIKSSEISDMKKGSDVEKGSEISDLEWVLKFLMWKRVLKILIWIGF